jgi:hypothetical protein
MLGVFPKNSDTLGTASVLGIFSKLNITPWDIDENWTS